jgi:hypothetical protein
MMGLPGGSESGENPIMPNKGMQAGAPCQVHFARFTHVYLASGLYSSPALSTHLCPVAGKSRTVAFQADRMSGLRRIHLPPLAEIWWVESSPASGYLS